MAKGSAARGRLQRAHEAFGAGHLVTSSEETFVYIERLDRPAADRDNILHNT